MTLVQIIGYGSALIFLFSGVFGIYTIARGQIRSVMVSKMMANAIVCLAVALLLAWLTARFGSSN